MLETPRKPSPGLAPRRSESSAADKSRNPMRARSFGRTALISLTVGASLALTGCDQRFGLPKPSTTQGKDVMDLWLFCMWVAIALGAFVFFLLFYSLIRHRRRNNDLPKQTEGNNKLELFYTVVPFILVAVLFGIGTKYQIEQTRIANDNVRINVTGFQWNWRFQYPDEGITVVGSPQTAGDTVDNPALPEMVLPVNERVRFNLTTADVNHSFFVPGFLTKRDLIPGIRNVIEVTPNRTGTFVGHCAELCGLNHSQMNFRVRVVPKAEYDAWVSTKKSQGQA